MEVATEPKSTRKEHGLFHDAVTKRKLKEYVTAIRKWRFENGPLEFGLRQPMKQIDFAKKIGCSYQQVRNIESGACHPSFAIMCKIFTITGVKPF
jgi:transcriptional regulator with XRE-family HTH domain